MQAAHSSHVKLAAHIEACRPDTLFHAGLAALGGALLSRPDTPLHLLFLAWLVPTLAWIASLYGGDYFDRELDALTKPHRPVPSGRISAKTARNTMIGLIGIAGTIAVVVNPATLLLAAAATVFGIAYARYLKGHGLWGNTARGLPTALTVFWGALAVQAVPGPALVPLALMFWVHDSGSNLLGALCDRDGDRLGGYWTYPAQRGDAATVRALTAFTAGWLALAVIWPLVRPVTGAEAWAYAAVLAVAAALAVVSLSRVRRAPRPIPRAAAVWAHEIIVIERLVLGASVVAAAGRYDLALAVALPSVLVTVL
ncbi:MAG: UbiA family prenyltransferase, partial [Umezawaea sp.]